jgi:riboflavin kinase / FMN adenylyltransferase
VNIYQGFESVGKIKNPVLTIGTFDGVHLGHQKIIEQLNKEADRIGGESVLFTFFPHPRMVLNPTNHQLKLIQSQEEKIEKLRVMGLKHLIIQPFTKEFSNLSAEEFVESFLLNYLNVNTIVVGYDHQFGKNREGSLAYLKEKALVFNFNVIEIPAKEIDEVNVSSTKIRNALTEGNISIANSYLNEPFQLNGTIIHGKGIGSTIGFPTANLKVDDPFKIIPKNGVYAVEVVLPNQIRRNGMMNIGTRPTINKNKDIQIEIFIFDFSEKIYGQKIKALFLDRIRDEIAFDSLESLKNNCKMMKKIFVLYLLVFPLKSWTYETNIDSLKIYSWDEVQYANPDTIFALSFHKLKLEKLPKELEKFTSLITLDLGKNKLTELPSFISEFTKLQEINVEKNKLSNFPVQICALSNLNTLILNRNQFTQLPECIQYLQQLKYIDLWDTPVASFPEAFLLMPNLKKLDVRGIKFSPSFQKRWIERLPWVKINFDAPCDCME